MEIKNKQIQKEFEKQDQEFENLIEILRHNFYELKNPNANWGHAGSRGAIICGIKELHTMEDHNV